MIIKQNGFHISVPQKRTKLLVLTGNDPFLINYFKQVLKKAWNLDPEQTSVHRFDIHKPNTFEDALGAMQHRDLFATDVLIDLYYEKNQVDKSGKTFLETCLNQNNPDCLIIFHAPLLSEKKLAFLANHPDCTLLHIKTPMPNIVERWISEQLKHANFRFSPLIPKILIQYTQNNLLACSQVLEKIKLCHAPCITLVEADIKPLLIDQSIYQLYELRDACLQGSFDKAISIFEYAQQEGEEPVLMLWSLTHEIRQLIRLHEMQQSGEYTLQAAFNHLNIWRTQESLYRMALTRLNLSTLLSMLAHALQLDFKIKTSQTGMIKLEFERLIFALCQGQIKI